MAGFQVILWAQVLAMAVESTVVELPRPIESSGLEAPMGSFVTSLAVEREFLRCLKTPYLSAAVLAMFYRNLESQPLVEKDIDAEAL